MKIKIYLYASFRINRFKTEVQEYPPETKIDQVLKKLNISEKEVGIIIKNCRHSSLSEHLNDGDVLSFMPLVGGG